MEAIGGLATADRPWRARYAFWDPDEPTGVRIEKYNVIAWAASGTDVWPVRVDSSSGRGVLVGSDVDPDRDALLVVGMPGEDWEHLPGMDSRIRGIIRAGVEGEEGEFSDEVHQD
jgi:hypothetical protein